MDIFDILGTFALLYFKSQRERQIARYSANALWSRETRFRGIITPRRRRLTLKSSQQLHLLPQGLPCHFYLPGICKARLCPLNWTQLASLT